MIFRYCSKGAIQSKKKKKCMEISIPRAAPHPPPGGMEIYNLFFLSFWHRSEQLWKNSLFPLEKLKILRKWLPYLTIQYI